MVHKNSLVKKQRKESSLMRELTVPLQQAFNEQEATKGFYVTRIELSDGLGLCTIYLACMLKDKDVDAALRVIKGMAKSTRGAVAKLLEGRYTPEIVFTFDKHLDKIRELDDILARVSKEVRDRDLD